MNEHQFKPWSKYPAIERHLTVEMACKSIGELTSVAREHAAPEGTVETISYEPSGMVAQGPRVTLAFRFQSMDRTLRSAEVDMLMESIEVALRTRGLIPPIPHTKESTMHTRPEEDVVAVLRTESEILSRRERAQFLDEATSVPNAILEAADLRFSARLAEKARKDSEDEAASQVANFEPIADRVLVQRDTLPEEVKLGSIVVPIQAREKPLEATVLRVGPGRLTDNGQRHPVAVRPGDKILIGKYSGTEVVLDGREGLLMLNEGEIFGVLKRAKAHDAP